MVPAAAGMAFFVIVPAAAMAFLFFLVMAAAMRGEEVERFL
jgi:ABC-type transport system involved in cytochrome c biogenesis permease subunit